MADLSRFRRKGTLGAPPPISEASVNLDAPERAPAAPEPADAQPAPEPQPEVIPPARPQLPAEPRLDGRSARRTGRTRQFATRVTEAYDERVRRVAARDKLLLAELLELSLEAYEAAKGKVGGS